MTDLEARLERLELDNKALEGQLEKIKRLHTLHRKVMTENQKKLIDRLLFKDPDRQYRANRNSVMAKHREFPGYDPAKDVDRYQKVVK